MVYAYRVMRGKSTRNTRQNQAVYCILSCNPDIQTLVHGFGSAHFMKLSSNLNGSFASAVLHMSDIQPLLELIRDHESVELHVDNITAQSVARAFNSLSARFKSHNFERAHLFFPCLTFPRQVI